MKIRILIIAMVMSSTFFGCATTPTKPVLSTDQSLTKDGYVQSKKNNFVVRIGKMSTSSRSDFNDIARYGLPIRITVANLSTSPIVFGPEQIQLIKNDHIAKPLTAQRLEQIKKNKQTRNTALNMLMGAMAFATAAVGGNSNDSALAASSQQQATDTLTYAIESHSTTHEYNEKYMNGLKEQYSNTLLQRVLLKPKKVADGLVYFENINTGDAFIIVVKTGSVEHRVVYEK